jgi:SAM-dependent methyltransferase
MTAHNKTGSNSKEWWNNLADKLNGYKTAQSVRFDGPNGEAEFADMAKHTAQMFPNVLDVGCADGRFTLELAAHARSITGIDLSERMIHFAKEGVTASLSHAQFVIGDARRMPFASDSFDLVISRRGPVSIPAFLDEAIRVVRPGGAIMEITIGDYDAIELKRLLGRGQGYPLADTSRKDEICKRIGGHSDLALKLCREFRCGSYYPKLDDIAELLASTPIVEDFEPAADWPVLQRGSESLRTANGFRRTCHRIIWLAEKKQLRTPTRISGM